ncbi:hypothetical protein H8K35_16095 [Undibacterium sp. LX40W]|uniref:Uncharacterized protein n=1 Tax=Undibacterium nitidum TaxID=2762298 RepID=A0A923KV88_9BURK|nr:MULTISPECIES: hypothetical protein [Undibacterium]MBC3882917.1 hypothetical protein [Undibacterium nitidum]MBC3893198.1 hypothetical protein [Undibacterium sp. LX40W]
MLRILIGFIYAALWFPTTVFIFTEYVYKINGGIEAFLFSLSITGPAVLISMPIFYLIRHHKPIQLLDCLLAGLLIPILILIGFGTVTSFAIATPLAPLCIGVGMISAIVFWVVGVRQTLNSSFYQ